MALCYVLPLHFAPLLPSPILLLLIQYLLEVAMEFLNTVHVRLCFFNTTGFVHPFPCFFRW